jgi:hypothetical protein
MPRPATASVAFPAEAFRFYEQLGAENTKAFWTQHKRDYEEYVKAPFETLADGGLRANSGHVHGLRRIGTSLLERQAPTRPLRAVTEGEAASVLPQVSAERPARLPRLLRLGRRPTRARTERPSTRRAVSNSLACSTRIAGQHFRNRGQRVEVRAPGLSQRPSARAPLRHKGVYVSRSPSRLPKWVHTPKALDRIVTTWRATAAFAQVAQQETSVRARSHPTNGEAPSVHR